MAKKKPLCKKVVSEKTKQPEFKPGDKPYCQFGNIILNKNVPWAEVIVEILDKGYALNDIANYAETTLWVLNEVVKLNYDVLPFRAGARIITLHAELFPELYID